MRSWLILAAAKMIYDLICIIQYSQITWLVNFSHREFLISCIILVYFTFIFIAFMLNRFFPHWFSAKIYKFATNCSHFPCAQIFISMIQWNSFIREVKVLCLPNFNQYIIQNGALNLKCVSWHENWRTAIAIILNTHSTPNQYYFLPIKYK